MYDRLLKYLDSREIFSISLKHVDLLERNRVNSLWQRDIKGHTGCVNALEFSGDEKYLLSGGDDGIVTIWLSTDLIGTYEPKPLRTMKSRHYSNIFSLGFSLDGKSAYSAGNDSEFITHDVETGAELYRYEASNAIHRLDVHPNSDGVCVFGTEEGEIVIVDTLCKQSSAYKRGVPVFSATYNPVKPELLCVAMYHGLFIYDVRNMKSPCMKLEGKANRCTFGRWTPDGSAIVALTKIDGLSYFPNFDSDPILLSDPEFLNSCTMKSCTFVDDRTVLCGSDQWDIFAWHLPVETQVEKVKNAYTILRGHRSIVNHIRHSKQNQIIVSSGVEKIIKCWTSLELCPGAYRDPVRRKIGSPSTVVPGVADNTEEDLYTLYQFDHYLEHARRRKIRNDNYAEEDTEPNTDSDSENPTSFLQNILNVALIDWGEFGNSSSNESYAHTEQSANSSDRNSSDEDESSTNS